VKPAPFAYESPAGLDEALALLAEHGDEAKVLAGGQSLLPLLNFRLARPALLVDVNRLDELAHIRRRGGRLRIGALTRTRTLERSRLVAGGWGLLREAVRLSGHPQIRSRGTVGGSVAHADPAAELPAALTALDARFRLRSARGSRTLAPDEFFRGYLTTALEPDELLVEVEVDALPPGAGSAFVEYARVHGDFALAGAAVCHSHGSARVVLLSAGAIPLRAPEAERALLAGEDARSVGHLAAAEAETTDRYRRALIAELVRRAVEAA
jgi:CO/xanthine dehydrogenase FAD-binding subunit